MQRVNIKYKLMLYYTQKQSSSSTNSLMLTIAKRQSDSGIICWPNAVKVALALALDFEHCFLVLSCIGNGLLQYNVSFWHCVDMAKARMHRQKKWAGNNMNMHMCIMSFFSASSICNASFCCINSCNNKLNAFACFSFLAVLLF